MWAFARIALLLALSIKVADAEYKDTCIIGAGPAGIGAALALTDKGLGTSFVVLEREKAVGGQTLPAYTDPATGAWEHGDAAHSILLAHCKQAFVCTWARLVRSGSSRRHSSAKLTFGGGGAQTPVLTPVRTLSAIRRTALTQMLRLTTPTCLRSLAASASESSPGSLEESQTWPTFRALERRRFPCVLCGSWRGLWDTLTPMQIAQTNATLRNGLLRAAVSAIPDLAATFRRYSAIYAQLKPTLMSLGGMPAILAANVSLAQNLDSWLQTNNLMQLLPFFTETAMQTVRHDILERYPLVLDQADSRDRAMDMRSTAQQHLFSSI